MDLKERHFKEALEVFKVIDCCLACYYEGKTFMYRPLSAQLRILFCDFQKNRNKALLLKLFSNIKLNQIVSSRYSEQGTFCENICWANKIAATSSIENSKPKLAVMPFEITRFKNGLEVCDLLIDKEAELISLEDWLNQIVTIHPKRIKLVDLIRTVADRGGGAHIHNNVDELLISLQKNSPCKNGIDALLTIAIGRFAQQIGWMVYQFYEKIGVRGKIEDLMKVFDHEHPSIKEGANIPKELFNYESHKYNLTSVTLA
jgi:hypothetical protein